MSIQKASCDCASEIIGDNWPPDCDDEDRLSAAADDYLKAAATAQALAAKNSEDFHYTISETSTRALDELGKHYHVQMQKHYAAAEDLAAAAGWLRSMATAVAAAKTAMNAAAAAHEPIHDRPKAPVDVLGGAFGGADAQAQKDADMRAHQDIVTEARSGLEHVLTAGEAAITAGNNIPAPPNGVPPIPTHRDSVSHDGPSDFPSPGAPAAAAPAAGGGATPGAATAAGAAGGVLPPEAFAAPGGVGAGAGAGGPAAGAGGMPGGGMPAGAGMPAGGGMPQMPQMPAGGGSPASSVGSAMKPLTDMFGKMAGGSGGTPLSEKQLDKLLAEQQPGDGGTAGDHQLPDGGGGDGKGDGKGDHDHKKTEGTHTQLTGPRPPTDPYSPGNSNAALNDPAAARGAPSPAASVVTAAPAAAGTPVMELSADESSAPAPAAPVTQEAAAAPPQQPSAQPPTVDQTAAGHVHAPSSNSVGMPAGGGLSAFPAEESAAVPMSGMPMMPPSMGGMGGLGASSGGGGGGAPVAPVLAAVPASVAGAAVIRSRDRDDDNPPVGSDAAVARILALPPQHGLAEQHLAGLTESFERRGWAATPIAVGVFIEDASSNFEPRARYIVATADGLSHVPFGVAVPAGVELLSAQQVAPSFRSDWAGHRHPGKKLEAFAQHAPKAGNLVYVVSSAADARARTVQTSTEKAALVASRRATAATASRTEIALQAVVSEDGAQEMLLSLGKAWGFHDADADTLIEAIPILWSQRWDNARGRNNEYPAILATYLYAEGLTALRENRIADAAYCAAEMLTVFPYDWIERSAAS